MMRRLLMSALVLSLSSLSALGDDTVPERTPWKKADAASVSDPASKKLVRWVVEGCAAYPVTVEGPSKQLVADVEPKAETSLPKKTGHPVGDE